MTKQVNNDQQIHIRLPEELATQAKVKAEKEKRPLSDVVRDFLRAWTAGIIKL